MKTRKGTYGSLPAILIIIMVVSMLTVFETVGMLSIADSKGAITGKIYDENGNMQFGSPGLLTEKPTAFVLTSSQKEYCVNEKVYHTYYTTIDASSSYIIEETELYQKLESNISCDVRQHLKKPDGTFTVGSFYPVMKTTFAGETAYSSGNTWFIPEIAGDYLIYAEARCKDSSRIWSVSEKTFTADECYVDDNVRRTINACNNQDTTYCENGSLYTNDYSFKDGECKMIVTSTENKACETVV